jgi:hypothetical protein
MKIKINGKDFTVFEYDDSRTILERWSITQPDSLPVFFRIDGKDFILAEGLALKTKDVRESIKALSADNLVEKSIIEGILTSYPGLKRSDIGILWIKKTYGFEGKKSKSAIDVTELRFLDKYIFATTLRAESAVSEFDVEVKSKRENLKKKIEEEDKIFTFLSKRTAVPVNEFVIEEITNQIIVKLPGAENILDVFNAFDVSKNIPFIALVYKKRRYFKIHPHTFLESGGPPDSWIDFKPLVPGLYFKVLNVPSGKLFGRQIMLENLYSDAIWHPEDRIEINFRVKHGISEQDMSNKIFDSLGKRITYEILTTKQTAIKGTFTIPRTSGSDFNRAIFADLVHTNPTLRYFLFFNEKQKTVFNKPRFYVYYTPNQQGQISSSLTLTITPIGVGGVGADPEDGPSAQIRISHATNLQQANAARLIFSKLLSIYNAEFQRVVDTYTEMITNFSSLASVYQKKTKKREDKKTGPRAKALRKFKPDLFGSRYPDQCQKEKQPYIIKTREEAEELALAFGDPHKVMHFEGAWYACDPREPDDKNFKHLFPGLKENRPKEDKKYKEAFPLLPCCYTQDQFEKGASHLRQYYKDIGDPDSEIMLGAKKDREGGMGYIVGPLKKLNAGRYGEMPFNWEKLLAHLQIEKIKKGRQTIYPFLRHGVLPGPDSFIHCLERAFNARYAASVAEDKRDLVMQIRNTIAGSGTTSGGPLILGRQELYDFTIDATRTMLLDPQQYIDPRRWVSVMSAHYKCNIFLYVVDSQNPNGNIVVPNNSQAYLLKDLDVTTIPSIMIVMYETGTEDYPYQCEIICYMLTKGGKIKGIDFTFTNDPISNMAAKLLYDANEVFVVSTVGYEPYLPVHE